MRALILPIPFGERVASPTARSGEGEKWCALPGNGTVSPPLPDHHRVNSAPRCLGQAGGLTGPMIPKGERE